MAFSTVYVDASLAVNNLYNFLASTLWPFCQFCIWIQLRAFLSETVCGKQTRLYSQWGHLYQAKTEYSPWHRNGPQRKLNPNVSISVKHQMSVRNAPPLLRTHLALLDRAVLTEDFRIDARGFFKADLDMFINIMGASVTYTVVLSQAHNRMFDEQTSDMSLLEV